MFRRLAVFSRQSDAPGAIAGSDDQACRCGAHPEQNLPVRAASVVAEMVRVFPDSVGRHVERGRHVPAPEGGLHGLALVISDLHRAARLDLAYGHVSVHAAVAVVA